MRPPSREHHPGERDPPAQRARALGIPSARARTARARSQASRSQSQPAEARPPATTAVIFVIHMGHYRRLLRFLRPHLWRMGAATACNMLASVFDAFAFTLMIPF